MAKDILLARRLKSEIARLKSESTPLQNTIERAQVVLRHLDGESTYKISKDSEGKFNKASVAKWTKKYKDSGIEALIDMENIPLNSPKRDTTHDKELAIRVAGDLDKLKKSPDVEQYKNTITRTETIITVLKKEKSARKLAKDLDTVH